MRLRSADLALGVAAVLFAMASLSARAADRVALVIGNGAYEHHEKLSAPVRNANDVAEALTRLDFVVTKVTDATYRDMMRAVRDFREQVATAKMAVVYFSGQGIEAEQGTFLIPIDADLKDERDVPFESIGVNRIAEQALQGAKRMQLIIVDAGRDNPLRRYKYRCPLCGISGLPQDVFAAFASSPGEKVGDVETGNSPYTSALLRHIETPALDIGALFRRVREDVVNATNRAQQPFFYGALPSDDIFLKEGAKP